MTNSSARPPQRIVHVTEAAAGGVRTHLHYIISGLAERGLAVELLLSPGRADPDIDTDIALYRQIGCHVSWIPMQHRPSPVHDIPALHSIRAHLTAAAPCIVHAHATKAGLLARLAARGLPGVRTVYSPHAFCFEGFSSAAAKWFGKAMERALIGRTDLFVLVSGAERQLAITEVGIPEHKIAVIENGLPSNAVHAQLPRDQARAELAIPETELAVGVPGRLAPQKGQDWLLEALPRLKGAAETARFYFCGNGPEEARLKQKAEELSVAERLHWQGFVPDLSRHLKAFDVLVLPSRYEGLSYALLEALASDVPLVVSDIPAHFPSAAVRDAVRAVPLHDAAALAAAISESFTTSGPPTTTSTLVREHFSLARQVQRLSEAYERLSPNLNPPP